MALIDDVKVALRVTSGAFDSEIQGLVAAAKRDLNRVGVPEALCSEDDPDPLVRMAVILFAKSRFGFDNDEADRFEKSYRQTVIDLLNSPTSYGGDDEVE